jgi:hypothetical protein
MKIHILVCAALIAACSSSINSPEPAAAIVNGSTKAAATTHWSRTVGAVVVNLGLYGDGTGSFNACGTPVNITWSRTSGSSISLTGFTWSCSTTSGFSGTITGFIDIAGSISDQVFTTTANLNGSTVAQTWALSAGPP